MRRACLLVLAACAPDLGPPEYLVDRPRVIAVQASPAEVAPGQAATFRVLAVGPDGPLDASAAAWGLCTAPLPLTETGTVASACAGDLPVVARGSNPTLSTSPDACSLFGPIATSETHRARNPDATGGFYQPMRVQTEGATAFAQERLLCPLAQATLPVALDFQRRYTPNQNPTIERFAASIPLDAVPKGTHVELTVTVGTASMEVFPLFEPAPQALVDTSETLTVSWYATAGALLEAQTTVEGVSAQNEWIAPSTGGRTFLWAVLHDSRGGVDMAQLAPQVAP
ncbi:MAG TPA: hypothetical protein VGH20_15305 [Myxococcales bacterium]